MRTMQAGVLLRCRMSGRCGLSWREASSPEVGTWVSSSPLAFCLTAPHSCGVCTCTPRSDQPRVRQKCDVEEVGKTPGDCGLAGDHSKGDSSHQRRHQLISGDVENWQVGSCLRGLRAGCPGSLILGFVQQQGLLTLGLLGPRIMAAGLRCQHGRAEGRSCTTELCYRARALAPLKQPGLGTYLGDEE